MEQLAVANVVVDMVVDLADRLQLPLAALCEGLSVDEAELRGPLRSLEWDPFCALMERIEARVGRAAFLEGCAAVPSLSPVTVRLLGHFVSVRALMNFACRWVGPGLYPMYLSTWEELPAPGEGLLFHLHLELKDGYRGSRPVFEAHGPATAALPSLIGQPPLALRAETTDRRGDYWLSLAAAP